MHHAPIGSTLSRVYFTIVGDYDRREQFDVRDDAEMEALRQWAAIPDGALACPPAVEEQWVFTHPGRLTTTVVPLHRSIVSPEHTMPELEEGDPVPTQQERAAVRDLLIEQRVRRTSYAWPAA